MAQTIKYSSEMISNYLKTVPENCHQKYVEKTGRINGQDFYSFEHFC